MANKNKQNKEKLEQPMEKTQNKIKNWFTNFISTNGYYLLIVGIVLGLIIIFIILYFTDSL